MTHPWTPPTRRPSILFGTWTALLLALAALAFDPPASAAQQPEDPLALPEIVVTGTQVPIDRALLPTPVSVLTHTQLREDGIRTLADALQFVPGLTVVRSGSAGSQTSLFMRGGESSYVKVLVDGVTINESGGAIDIADLSTEQVERIEVMRGPASVLYGSDAVAGVVQIFTTRGRDGPRIEASAFGGTGERRYESGRYALFDTDAMLIGRTGNVSYTLGGSRAWDEGAYPLNNERTHHTANARLGWQAGNSTELTFATRFSDSESGFPTDGAGNLIDENAALDRRLWTNSAEVAAQIRPGMDARLLLGLTTRNQLARDEPDNAADTLGIYASRMESDLTRSSADLRLNFDLPVGMVTLGTAHERARGSTEYESESEWGPTAVQMDYDRSNSAAYVQLLASPVSRIHVTSGARMDRNEAFGRFETYRLGLSWRVANGTRLRGAMGSAFREPTFAENFGSGFDTGNPDLVPERTRSWELGAEKDIVGVTLGVSWFDQTFRDLIQYTFAAEDPDDPNYFNVGAARSEGLEVTGASRSGRVDISASYSYLRTRVLDPGLATDATFAEGSTLLRRPGHSGSATGRLSGVHGTVRLTFNVIGKREDLDFGAGFPAPRLTLPRHTTVDLSAAVALPIGWDPEPRILVRVDNVFDADFQSIAGFPAPGRIIRLGLRVGAGG